MMLRDGTPRAAAGCREAAAGRDAKPGNKWPRQGAPHLGVVGERGAKPSGVAVAAGTVSRLRNPFLSLIHKARNGADRRGEPFCCCSCFLTFQDFVLEQAPRDGPHEAAVWPR